MPISLGMGEDAATAGACSACAATEGTFLFNALYGSPNSLGMSADAATAGACRASAASEGIFLFNALHGTPNSPV